MAEKELQALLKRLAAPPEDSPTLTLDEIKLLANSLSPPSSRHDRSLAYLALSKFCQDAQNSSPEVEKTDQLVLSTFKPYLGLTLGTANQSDEERDVDPSSLVPLTSLLTAIFPLASGGASALLTVHLGDGEEDQADPLAILLELAELPSPLQPALAELLGSAASTKVGREIVRQRATEWLRGAVDYQVSDGVGELGALCAVALSKLGQVDVAPAQDNSDSQLTPEERSAEDRALALKLMDHIEQSSSSTSTPASPATISTLEGLSVLSLRPQIKDLLASSPTFLRSLLALSPTLAPKPGSLPVTPRASMDLSSEKLFDTVENSLCYGLTTVLVNLTTPKPTLSAEDQQIVKLRAMAISANKNALYSEEEEDPLESESEVNKRVKAVITAGAVKALHGLARAESKLVKEGLGKLCRNLVEDKSDRLGFVRDGGFKVLSGLLRDLLAATTAKPTNITSNGQAPLDVLPAIQASAKLIITTSPTLLFPPPHLTTSLNSLTPLYHLLVHPSAISLQRFEALMALTNLASLDPSIGSRIVDATIKSLSQADSAWSGSGREDSIRVVGRVEELMLDDNELVRRAATELICNLISSPKGYEYFSGESSSSSSGRVKSRLNVLLVLAGVDDLQTRLAAGGALAIITESPMACQALLSGSSDIDSTPTTTQSTPKRSIWSRVLDLLNAEEPEMIDEDGTPIPIISSSNEESLPNPDLVHRGVIILLNLVQYIMSQSGQSRETGVKGIREAGVEEKMMGILRTQGVGEEVLVPAVECLKMLKRA